MRVLATGLENPWEVTWGPDGKLWVTERTGLRIIRVDPATGERRIAASLASLGQAVGPGGVLGMALHPRLLRNAGRDEVYVAVTYLDPARPADARVTDPASPFRHLFAKVIRLRYEASSFALVDPVTILAGCPPATITRHPARLRPRRTLHCRSATGRQPARQFLQPVQSQRLPTRAEVGRDWSAYEGKTLRFTTDGGIPTDNPS